MADPIEPIHAANNSTFLRPLFIKMPAKYDPIIKVKVAELPTMDSMR